MSYLNRYLLESSDNDDDKDIDKTAEDDVEEAVYNSIPLSVEIESFCADTASVIVRANEVYELTCLVGGTQVVSEGSGSGGARVVLEGAVKNFFQALLKRIKAIGEWIKKMWQKLIGKIKGTGKDNKKKFDQNKKGAEKAIAKAKEKAKSDGGSSSSSSSGNSSGSSSSNSSSSKNSSDQKSSGGTTPEGDIIMPESIHILDVEKGDKYFDNVMGHFQKCLSDSADILDGDYNRTKSKEFADKDLSAEGLMVSYNQFYKSYADMDEYIRREYVGETSQMSKYDKKHYFSQDNLKKMEEVVTKAYNLESESKKAIDKLEKERKLAERAIELRIDSVDDELHDAEDQRDWYSNGMKYMNSCVAVVTHLVNFRVSLLTNAASTYTKYVEQIAKHAEFVEATYMQDSIDYSIYLESGDIITPDEDPNKIDTEDDDYTTESYMGGNSFLSSLLSF